MLKNLNKIMSKDIRQMLVSVLNKIQRPEVHLPDEGIVHLCGQSMFRGAFVDCNGKLRLTMLIDNKALEQCNGGLVKVVSYGELDHSDPSIVFVNITICRYKPKEMSEIDEPGVQIGFKSSVHAMKRGEIDYAMAILEQEINAYNEVNVEAPDAKS